MEREKSSEFRKRENDDYIRERKRNNDVTMIQTKDLTEGDR